MNSQTKRRVLLLSLSFLALFVSTWLELFLQRNQAFVGAGISRPFLFLLINQHVVVVVILLYLIVRQSIKLFLERHKESPGSVFKRNLLFAFTLFSIIPSCFVFFTAGKFITTSIDDWFHARIKTGLYNGMHLHEQQTDTLRKQLQTLGRKISQQFKLNAPIQKLNSENQIYIWLANNLQEELKQEVRVWRSYRKLNDRTMQSLRAQFLRILWQHEDTENTFDFYGSLYWTKKIKNHWIILVNRYPESVRYHLIEIQNSISDYEQLESMRNPLYTIYTSTFIIVTLLILLLSIWAAFYLARGISTPIQQLLVATEKLSHGDWNVKIDYNPSSDLRSVAIAFNNMTQALRTAKYQLELKNEEMKRILESVQAAVFLINHHGRVVLFNAAAKNLTSKYLGLSLQKNKKVSQLGKSAQIKFFELVRELNSSKKNVLSREVSFKLKTESAIWMIHLTIIKIHNPDAQNEENELLVVVEDLTNVVKANTIKTWQEAAKQVAHEIKNPLTPIQLATQRLQRKFSQKQLNDEKMFFDCTDTILNQVSVIKELVSHFAEFASMPTPMIELTDINQIIQEILSLYQLSYPSIEFKIELQQNLPQIKTDKQKIKRAFVNLFDNSIRALLSTKAPSKNICINTQILDLNRVTILISDNGPGVAESVKDRLFLPYVSTENKNMGLGLAIVHDTIAQLGGSIHLLQTKEGAAFQIILPI
jgi:two-component system nitrogen regulation sensor histidine kinase NtrY